MDVELIREEPAAAKRKLDAYAKSVERGATAEIRAIRDAYRALARGKPLLRLTHAFARGGWDDQGRPRFAAARADRREVRAVIRSGSIAFCSGARDFAPVGSLLRVDVPLAAMPTRPTPAGSAWWTGRAIVPIVPADVVPTPCDLSARLILWEAEWRDAPRDPLLLYPLGGDLYVVEAAWDLTEIERAVLAEHRGRRS